MLVTGSGEAQTEIGFTLDSLEGITGRGHGVYGEGARVLGDPGTSVNILLTGIPWGCELCTVNSFVPGISSPPNNSINETC